MSDKHHRSPGDGSIREVAPGVWRGELMLAGKRYSRNGSSRAAVVRALNELRYRGDTGQLGDPRDEREKVGDYLRRWVAGRRGTVGEKHWRNLARNVELHLMPGVGHLALADLRAEHLRALYAELQAPPASDRPQARGLAPKSVHHTHNTIAQALSQAVADGALYRNVAAFVRLPKLTKREHRTLTREQAARLSIASAPTRFGCLWAVALYTALREGELLALTWADVDWAGRTLAVRRSLDRIVAQAPATKAPKSAAGTRLLDLPEPALAALQAQQEAQGRDKRRAGVSYVDFGLVFASRRGTPLSARNVLRAWHAIAAKAGVPADAVVHDLRHTGVSAYLAAGVPLPEVANIAGHATPQVTATIYSHVIKRASRHAADAITAVFGPPPTTSPDAPLAPVSP